jgi:hypothetical protein
MVILKTNQKNYVYFMPHAFSQNEHPFGQCRHFNQVKHFEKLWFIVVFFTWQSIDLEYEIPHG